MPELQFQFSESDSSTLHEERNGGNSTIELLCQIVQTLSQRLSNAEIELQTIKYRHQSWRFFYKTEDVTEEWLREILQPLADNIRIARGKDGELKGYGFFVAKSMQHNLLVVNQEKDDFTMSVKLDSSYKDRGQNDLYIARI